MRKDRLLCILGPTATGKTRLAVAAARRLCGEIISADSRQVYRRMDIGTGKDLEEYSRGGPPVPYRLVDIVDPGTEFNLFEYVRSFIEAWKKIEASKALPIMCGGTGLYIDAVLSRYELVEAPPDNALRGELEGLGNDDLKRRLLSFGKTHNITDTSDRSRMIRAIEIAEYSAMFPERRLRLPPIQAQVFGLRIDRNALKRRIGDRLDQRLGQGMIEEVRSLLDTGVPADMLKAYGLEYRYVLRHIEGELDFDEMHDQLESAIHDFARRQVKWFRRMERKGTRIHWLDAAAKLDELVEIVCRGVCGAGLPVL